MSLFFLFPPQMETSEPLSTSAIDNGGNHVNVVASHRLTTVLTRPKALFLFQIPSQKERPPPMYGLGPSLGAKKNSIVVPRCLCFSGREGDLCTVRSQWVFSCLLCKYYSLSPVLFFCLSSEGGREEKKVRGDIVSFFRANGNMK